MSALIELQASFAEIAGRLDLSTGAGADALRRHYIEPTMTALDKVVVQSFGTNRQPFKGKKYPATVDYVLAAGGAAVAFRLSPTGFWVFGQYGTKPHMIPVKNRQRLYATGAKHPVRGPVKHPGSKGKHAIDAAWRAIRHNQHAQISAAVEELMTGA